MENKNDLVSYEPKTKNRFVITMDTIPSFVMKI